MFSRPREAPAQPPTMHPRESIRQRCLDLTKPLDPDAPVAAWLARAHQLEQFIVYGTIPAEQAIHQKPKSSRREK